MQKIVQESKPKVILVDDNEIFLKLFKKYFTEQSYEVFIFNKGEDALRAIENTPDKFDLVILDLIMPEIDGFEVCRRIRQVQDKRQLPIIIVTSKSETGEILKGFEAGANDYVSKPFDRKELLARSKTLIELKQAIASNERMKEHLSKLNLFLQMHIHDLKNPLISIVLAAKKMVEKREFDTNLMAGIVDNSETIISEIGELLELIKLENGELQLKRSDVDISDVITKVTKNNSLLASDKKISVKKNVKSSLINADYDRIYSALTYIVSNSLKFSPEGSEINISSKVTNDNLLLTIKDMGPRINIEDTDTLSTGSIDIGAQDSSDRHLRSDALDLKIAKRIIELHGGKMNNNNNSKHGSEFIISLQIL